MIFVHDYVMDSIIANDPAAVIHTRFHTTPDEYKKLVSVEKNRTGIVVSAIIIAVIYTVICIAYITNATSVGLLITVLMLSAIVILIAYICGRYLIQTPKTRNTF